jgi:hypothetical protein
MAAGLWGSGARVGALRVFLPVGQTIPVGVRVIRPDSLIGGIQNVLQPPLLHRRARSENGNGPLGGADPDPAGPVGIAGEGGHVGKATAGTRDFVPSRLA